MSTKLQAMIVGALFALALLVGTHAFAYFTGVDDAEQRIAQQHKDAERQAESFTAWLTKRADTARATAKAESVLVVKWKTKWDTLTQRITDTLPVPYPVYVELKSACDSLGAACARAERANALFRAAVDSARGIDRQTIASLRVALATCQASKPSRATYVSIGGGIGLGAGIAACYAARGRE